MIKPKALAHINRAVELLGEAEDELNAACCEQAPDLAPKLSDLNSFVYKMLDLVQSQVNALVAQLKLLREKWVK